MKFIYRGIRYQCHLKENTNSEITPASLYNQQLKRVRVDFFTYRGISYSKCYPF